eukprot:m.49637 g.49637  ORF g.49637 m.49637 type:complete len:258 (-) comp15335_c0_seq1:179-952(-)
MEEIRATIDEIQSRFDIISEGNDTTEADLRLICMKNKRTLLFLRRQLSLANHIQVLHLHRCRIDDPGAKIIARFLKRNTTITSISFAGNDIGNAGATAIANAVARNDTLQYLSLRENQLGDVACRALGKALRQNRRLDTLSLEQNFDISNAGAQALGQGLVRNGTLKFLALSDTSVGDAGAEILANVLRVSASLQTLLLGRNEHISANGARYLTKAVQDRLESNRLSAPQCIALPYTCRDTVAAYPRAVRRIVSFDE